MPLDHNRVQWSAANTGSVPASGNLTSDTFTPGATTVGPLQAHIKVNNGGTPATGDVITVYALQTGGDTDGVGGADEFDTAAPETALPLCTVDTVAVNPAQLTVPLPWPTKAYQFYAENAGAANAITISIMVSEQQTA